MEDLFRIKGKNIVITGGAGVLGGEMSRAFARRGARLCLLDYNVRRANQVCKEIEAEGHIAIPIQSDVLDKNKLQEACACALESLGAIDVLINAAGGNLKEATCSAPTSFFELPADALHDVFNLNCLGTFLPCQVFGRYMAQQNQGVIINIASMNAFRPLTNVAAYMAQRHSPHIRVNAVAPGFFLTKQNRFLLFDEKTGALTPRGQTILDHTPMGRLGDPKDLIGPLIWLMSDAAQFVTGIIVPIDGGFSAFSGV